MRDHLAFSLFIIACLIITGVIVVLIFGLQAFFPFISASLIRIVIWIVVVVLAVVLPVSLWSEFRKEAG